MKRILASILLLAAAAAQAQIAVGGATPNTRGASFPAQTYLPGLWQVRNGDSSTGRRELGPVMGFVYGESGTGGSSTSPLDGVTTTWTEKDAWTYKGRMFMERGTNYTFATSIDDFAIIIIDGLKILDQDRCTFTTASYFCTHTGWHDIVIKVSDAGGCYGQSGNFTPGIAYNVTNQKTPTPLAGWTQLVDPGDGSLLRTPNPDVRVIVAAQMRENDPTVMDVDYIVYSDSPTVNVRALAFEDGDRGFAAVVRPETFIEGTDANLGDGIAANVAHRLSWKVSSDWATDLAKVKFEVMAMQPGDWLLPDMHFVTIPAAEGHPKTTVSVNDLSVNADEITRDVNAFNGIYMRWPLDINTTSRIPGRIIGHWPLFSALLWLYGSNDPGVRLSEGVLWADQNELVRHAAFANNSLSVGPNDDPRFPRSGHWSINPNALRYVFGKMGYRLLEDAAELAWVNENTRLGLSPQQFRQYAVKTVEE